MKKLKILHVQLLPLLTGVQRVSLDELTRLNYGGFITYMVCSHQGIMTDVCQLNDIECMYAPNLVREISPINDIRAFFQLYKICKENKFDIVHTHSSKTGVLGRLAARLAGVPMIVHTVHGFAFPAAKNKFEKFIFISMEWFGTKLSDMIICLHDADKNISLGVLGAKKNKTTILPNGVDLSKFYPPSDIDLKKIKAELGLPSNALVIGMVGRLWKQKNPHALLNAAINILEKRNDIHFVFVGDGELRESLEIAASFSSNANNIHFLGWREDTERVLRAFDIFVLPSLWEGMPLAILEAQATGLPCIVSNIQGNNHLVSDGVSGLLFDLNEKRALEHKIMSLVDSLSKRKALGQCARKIVESQYDIEKRVSILSSIYNDFMLDKSFV